MKKHTVVCQEWLESERGWGQRPDGASLHLTESNRKEFVKEYWDRMPDGPAPDEYSREDGQPKLIDVTDEVYEKVKSSKNGVWFLQCDYRELKK